MRRIAATAACALLHDGAEIAFLDVREAGQFGEAHPLFAVPAPYSRLEALVARLVPRHSARLMLIDQGDGVAERAAKRLEHMGYHDTAILDGGIPAWAAEGFGLYKGVNVPSKTLGELAEQVWHPEVLQPEELARWRETGEAFALYDARPPQEYAKMRVPGSRCLPNGELAHRLGVAAPPARRPIVITCAGRTRGLTGAIGLRVAGYDRPVYALENGTQGWALAGQVLERGNDPDPFPPMTEESLAEALQRADQMMWRYGIEVLSAADIAAALRDGTRTTCVFDVRSAAEAAQDPIRAALHAPSGQLVQATDQWIGVRRARIVLCDDSGLRAALAAFWLKQLGFEPFVTRIDGHLRALPPQSGAAPASEPAERLTAPDALRRLATEGCRLVDLRGSLSYRRGHPAGAVWSVRPRLPDLCETVTGRHVLLIADDRWTADLAARDLREIGAARVYWIEGGHEALVAAGAPAEATPDRPNDSEAIDHLYFVHDRHDGNLEASRRYLEWERGLVGQLDARERAEFRLLAPH
jgi:rhodanese-related sulfurtransferase